MKLLLELRIKSFQVEHYEFSHPPELSKCANNRRCSVIKMNHDYFSQRPVCEQQVITL